jgi:hypothetical protein
VFVSLFFTESTRPAVAQFMQSYYEQFRVKPDFLAAQGFDAATLVASAVGQQRQSGAPFAVALGSIGSYEGLTGTMTIAESGEIERTFSVVQLVDDKVVELTEPITPSFVMRGDEALDGAGIPGMSGGNGASSGIPAGSLSELRGGVDNLKKSAL